MFNANPPHRPRSHTSDYRPRKTGGIRRWLQTEFRNWERRKMIETLRGMDDRLLRDLGIDRSDIPRVVDGFTDRELSMRPVSSDVEFDVKCRGHRAA
ncbi:DUF1127 domain-containing protein [Salipiger aestuarii]|uniref:DUF1127 domain-containing protein n=1 Tax=Salipiger aestuarii TaxID=568098 RepID=UPI001CC2C63E|nr:DUF1127 domain-containing protein [Salipiger aestuarii]